MGIFQQFPYSNFHEMNLDEIIKIVKQLQDEWAATSTEWASYKDFIDNYFANLDVSQEVLDALRVMLAAGDLDPVIDPVIAQETADWLALHITNPSNPPIDTSLTVAGAAADAKVTGDFLNDLEGDLIRSQLFNIFEFLTYQKPTNPTHNVQFTYVDKAKYTIVGTSNGTIAFDLYSQLNSMPPSVKAGDICELYVSGITTGMQLRVFFSTNGSSWDAQTYSITSNGQHYIAVPANAVGMLIRIYIPNNTVLNTTFECKMYVTTAPEVKLANIAAEQAICGIYPDIINTVGDYSISGSGWTPHNSTSRARTDIPYQLKTGDLITITRPDLVRMYIGYQGGTGNYYTSGGWLQENFLVPFDCSLVILLSYVTESTIPNAETLSQYIKIYKKEYVYKEIEKSNREISAVVKSVNHQGFNYIAPNESLAAYKLSKKYGYNYVECDVQKTSDGVYVLNHDNDISLTGTFYNISGGTPVLVTSTTLISNLTYAQLVSDYDIRKSLNDDFEHCKIATFEEFMELCKQIGLHAYVEIKTGGTADTQALHDIAKAYGMLDNVTWISSLINYLNQMKVYDGSVRLGYVVNNIDATVITQAQSVMTSDNDVFIDAKYQNITSTEVALCSAAGIELEAWIVNTKAAMQALDPYITRITSDKLKWCDVYKDF